ncbi:hypothetical protein BZA77DRAFT_264130 [Pyronema omphalodes]|nr:hypothetical protein BZA77DRAFT_264130 [Pyronema omphalodes]
MSSAPPAGIFVPVPTFFVKRGSPSYNSVAPPIDIETQVAHGVFLAKRGIRGLVLLGSTGEAIHLTRAERQIVIKSVRDGMAQNGFPDFPLMAGTATQSIEETIDLLNESAAAGANYGLVLAPGYFAGATSQEGLKAWFTAVADKSSIPILIYHYPAVSNNVVITPATIRALAAHPNIVGAKFSHGDISIHGQVGSDPEIDHKRFTLYTGLGQHLFPAMQVGVAGAIDGLAGFFPATVVRLFEVASAETFGPNERKEAQLLQLAISRGEDLVVKWGTVGIKEACSRINGFGDRDGTRLPLKGGLPGGDAEWQKWEEIMAALSKLEEAIVEARSV